MPERYPAKQDAMDYIDTNAQRLSDFDMEIWSYHEPAWREYRSAKAYVDFLRDDGWEVEEGSGEMPTAFVASFENGAGPVIGGYAEYDAVPGNSQQAVPYQAPREGLHPWAAGHTDPHSMLGVAGLSGFLAAKSAMEKSSISLPWATPSMPRQGSSRRPGPARSTPSPSEAPSAFTSTSTIQSLMASGR
jgi:aminobenzoyl-glutamate utilization protein B